MPLQESLNKIQVHKKSRRKTPTMHNVNTVYHQRTVYTVKREEDRCMMRVTPGSEKAH